MQHFTYVPETQLSSCLGCPKNLVAKEVDTTVDMVMVESCQEAAIICKIEAEKRTETQLKQDAKKHGYLFTNRKVTCKSCGSAACLYPSALVFKKGNSTIVACVCGYRRKE